jgi:hypothetical protein
MTLAALGQLPRVRELLGPAAVLWLAFGVALTAS